MSAFFEGAFYRFGARLRQVDSEGAMLAPRIASASTRTGVYTCTCEPRCIHIYTDRYVMLMYMYASTDVHIFRCMDVCKRCMYARKHACMYVWGFIYNITEYRTVEYNVHLNIKHSGNNNNNRKY